MLRCFTMSRGSFTLHRVYIWVKERERCGLSVGRIQSVWFNHTLCNELHIQALECSDSLLRVAEDLRHHPTVTTNTTKMKLSKTGHTTTANACASNTDLAKTLCKQPLQRCCYQLRFSMTRKNAALDSLHFI